MSGYAILENKRRNNEEKLIKRITTCLEEYGMPVFKDRIPALDVIQIMKDSGWKSPSDGLYPIDEKELGDLITNFFPAFQGDIGQENKNELRKQIIIKFGRPKSMSLEEIYKVLQEEHPHIINRKLAQAIKNALEAK